MHRWVLGLFGCVLVALAACSSGKPTGSPNAPISSVGGTASGPQDLPSGCKDPVPCNFEAGTYVLGHNAVVPGLQLTLPSGWSSTENDHGELNLNPPGLPDNKLFVWVDLVAVKST